MNALWLMLGTLTALRVPAPTHVDRTVGGRAMAIAPLGGALLALLTALPLALLLDLDRLTLSPLVWSTLVIGALAWLTRGMHLDGLADTADGLGSGHRGAGALEVMKKSDIGPFGVVTLVLVLLLQVVLLAEAIAGGAGPVVLAIALVTSRWMLPILCGTAFPPARSEGLGHTVAQGVTPRLQALAFVATAALVVAVVSIGMAGDLVHDDQVVRLLVGAPFVVLPALLLVLRAVRRFGGVTGDVYGAAVEITFTAALLMPQLALSL